MSTVKAAFEATLQRVKEGSIAIVPTQTQKLQLYAWYKQATEGDAPETGPKGAFDLVAKAKHAAWSRVRGMSQEDAMQQYVDFFKGA